MSRSCCYPAPRTCSWFTSHCRRGSTPSSTGSPRTGAGNAGHPAQPAHPSLREADGPAERPVARPAGARMDAGSRPRDAAQLQRHAQRLGQLLPGAGWGIRVGYPSAKLLRELSSRQRARVAGRIILALTANRYYALDGVRPGRRLATVAARLGAGRPLSIGLNDWYVVRGRASDGVLKVRRGVVQEVGIASKQLCHGRAAQRRLLRSFTAP